jgi:hypothetical protein
MLFMMLWVPIFAMLSKRAVPMLWHASLFLGLKLVGVFPPYISVLISGFHCFFL